MDLSREDKEKLLELLKEKENRIKYNYWLRYNRVPLNKEIECASRGSNPDHGVGNAE